MGRARAVDDGAAGAAPARAYHPEAALPVLPPVASAGLPRSLGTDRVPTPVPRHAVLAVVVGCPVVDLTPGSRCRPLHEEGEAAGGKNACDGSGSHGGGTRLSVDDEKRLL